MQKEFTDFKTTMAEKEKSAASDTEKIKKENENLALDLTKSKNEVKNLIS